MIEFVFQCAMISHCCSVCKEYVSKFISFVICGDDDDDDDESLFVDRSIRPITGNF